MSEGRTADVTFSTLAICPLLPSAVCSAQFPGTSSVGADEAEPKLCLSNGPESSRMGHEHYLAQGLRAGLGPPYSFKGARSSSWLETAWLLLRGDLEK